MGRLRAPLPRACLPSESRQHGFERLEESKPCRVAVLGFRLVEQSREAGDHCLTTLAVIGHRSRAACSLQEV